MLEILLTTTSGHVSVPSDELYVVEGDAEGDERVLAQGTLAALQVKLIVSII